MKSKEKILASIRKNKSAPSEVPILPDFERSDLDLLAHFEEKVTNGAGKVIRANNEHEIQSLLATAFPDAVKIISTSSKLPGTMELKRMDDPSSLDGVDLVVVESVLGVGENGGVWLSEKDLGLRVLPFITQHLVVILRKEDLVWNMGEAYRRIKIDADGFGLFVAGPSKTADIEQSLVIGAQGARSFTVIIM